MKYLLCVILERIGGQIEVGNCETLTNVASILAVTLVLILANVHSSPV